LISVTEILDAICDLKSLRLFEAIYVKGLDSEDLSVQLKLSRKEFYSRMSRLIKLGMVKRKNKKHFLTAFGKIVYDGHMTIKKAAENDYKLRAIDSMDLSSDITKYERNKMIDSLLDDKKIKEILMRDLS
jgi:predicted transcriptional regulator